MSPIIPRKMDTFRTFYDFSELKAYLKNERAGQSIGLVPTMGALHEGHLSLVKKAHVENDVVIVTIFVNPKQFNNQTDLKKYPRTIEKDLELLSEFKNVLICTPNEGAVYPKNDPYKPVDLGGLNEVLEGKYRPGHFDGVAHVVHNFFHFFQPNRAYFGLKDYQQFAVIKKMTKQSNLKVELVGCETIRNKSGLALSSRNQNLNNKEIEDALVIINTLSFIKENQRKYNIAELKENAIAHFKKSPLILEYLEIVDSESFEKLERIRPNSVCCIAAYCGGVRLIDNIAL